MQKGLVSIIMPAYNAEKFIRYSIESVLQQTYKYWELIIVDDCSKDKTVEVVQKYLYKDDRIKLYNLKANSGAAIARTLAIQRSNGEYVAFLDSDDTWQENKLEKQIEFMRVNNFLFTCTFYNKIDENGNFLNITKKQKKISNYNDLLLNSPGNSTVIYNANILGKITPPDIRKRNDYVLWLQVIKMSKNIYCLDEILSSHRIGIDSISSNKFSLIKYHWNIYRKIENLAINKCLLLTSYWCFKGIRNKFKQIIKEK